MSSPFDGDRRLISLITRQPVGARGARRGSRASAASPRAAASSSSVERRSVGRRLAVPFEDAVEVRGHRVQATAPLPPSGLEEDQLRAAAHERAERRAERLERVGAAVRLERVLVGVQLVDPEQSSSLESAWRMYWSVPSSPSALAIAAWNAATSSSRLPGAAGSLAMTATCDMRVSSAARDVLGEPACPRDDRAVVPTHGDQPLAVASPVRTALAAAATLGLLGAVRSASTPAARDRRPDRRRAAWWRSPSSRAMRAEPLPGAPFGLRPPSRRGSTTTTSASGSTPTAPAHAAPRAVSDGHDRRPPIAVGDTRTVDSAASCAGLARPPRRRHRPRRVRPAGRFGARHLASRCSAHRRTTPRASSPIPSGVRLFVDADRNVFAAPVGRLRVLRAPALPGVRRRPGGRADLDRLVAAQRRRARPRARHSERCADRCHVGVGGDWRSRWRSPEPAATTTPDPSAVVITEMWAGAQSSSLDADC